MNHLHFNLQITARKKSKVKIKNNNSIASLHYGVAVQTNVKDERDEST